MKKTAKILLQGSENYCEMEPNVISGRVCFDVGRTLISCNNTWCLLDFQGFQVPGGCQNAMKNNSETGTRNTPAQSSVFYNKNAKLVPNASSDLA